MTFSNTANTLVTRFEDQTPNTKNNLNLKPCSAILSNESTLGFSKLVASSWVQSEAQSTCASHVSHTSKKFPKSTRTQQISKRFKSHVLRLGSVGMKSNVLVLALRFSPVPSIHTYIACMVFSGIGRSKYLLIMDLFNAAFGDDSSVGFGILY